MKPKLWFSAVLLSLLLLSACAPLFTSGTVVSKDYEPERRWTQFIPMLVGKVTILMPFNHYDDEDWTVTIESEGETETFYVDESLWNEIEIGSYVDFGSYNTYDDIQKERAN